MSKPTPARSEHEITQLLQAWGNGDITALDQLYELVYDDLRRLAHNLMRKERPGHFLQTTGLVNEVYVKFARAAPKNWGDRQHFRRVCARAMRCILIDIAKANPYLSYLVQIDDEFEVAIRRDLDILALEDALRDLEKFDPELAEIVELKFYHGLTFVQIGQEMGYNEKRIRTEWQTAKAWLYRELDRKHDLREVATDQASAGTIENA